MGVGYLSACVLVLALLALGGCSQIGKLFQGQGGKQGASKVHVSTEAEKTPTESTEKTTETKTAETTPAAKVALPDVVGLASEEAVRQLTEAGKFNVVVKARSNEMQSGRVFKQDPAAGTVMEPGDTVYIIKSLGPAIQVESGEPTVVRKPARRTTSGSSGGGSYILSASSSRRLTADDLAGLSNWQLTLARNEIYARHGRPFDKPAIRRYFEGQGWYSAGSFSESELSSTEKKNAVFIREYQERQFGTPASGP